MSPTNPVGVSPVEGGLTDRPFHEAILQHGGSGWNGSKAQQATIERASQLVNAPAERIAHYFVR